MGVLDLGPSPTSPGIKNTWEAVERPALHDRRVGLSLFDNSISWP